MSDNPDTKVCSHCAETIKVAAKVCPHCRYWQKLWSLSNPIVPPMILMLVLFTVCGVGVALVDRMFGPKTEFSEYSDQIRVVNPQFSLRESGTNLYVTVVGMLTNQSDVSWKDVGVEAQFLDKAGKLLDAITVNVDDYRGVVILPHGEAAFKIEGRAARPQSDYETFKCTVRWGKDAHALF